MKLSTLTKALIIVCLTQIGQISALVIDDTPNSGETFHIELKQAFWAMENPDEFAPHKYFFNMDKFYLKLIPEDTHKEEQTIKLEIKYFNDKKKMFFVKAVPEEADSCPLDIIYGDMIFWMQAPEGYSTEMFFQANENISDFLAKTTEYHGAESMMNIDFKKVLHDNYTFDHYFMIDTVRYPYVKYPYENVTFAEFRRLTSVDNNVLNKEILEAISGITFDIKAFDNFDSNLKTIGRHIFEDLYFLRANIASFCSKFKIKSGKCSNIFFLNFICRSFFIFLIFNSLELGFFDNISLFFSNMFSGPEHPNEQVLRRLCRSASHKTDEEFVSLYKALADKKNYDMHLDHMQKIHDIVFSMSNEMYQSGKVLPWFEEVLDDSLIEKNKIGENVVPLYSFLQKIIDKNETIDELKSKKQLNKKLQNLVTKMDNFEDNLVSKEFEVTKEEIESIAASDKYSNRKEKETIDLFIKISKYLESNLWGKLMKFKRNWTDNLEDLQAEILKLICEKTAPIVLKSEYNQKLEVFTEDGEFYHAQLMKIANINGIHPVTNETRDGTFYVKMKEMKKDNDREMAKTYMI